MMVVRRGFPMWMVVAIVIGLVATIVFYRHATDSGRKTEDWGYMFREEKWVPTLGGTVHLLYFFLQASIAAVACLFLLRGMLTGIPLGLSLVGAALYGLGTSIDIRRGFLTP